MPEQLSKRGAEVAVAGASAVPFQTYLVRLGAGGLNLKDELDVIQETQYSRLTNHDHDANGALTGRPGQTTFATAGTKAHSVRRLSMPASSSVTRVWGIDGSVFLGASGALASVDGGYSGDALCLVPHRPTLSGDPWMFVADRNRMRKIRGSDGLSLPIGLPAPTQVASATLGIEARTGIATFSAADGTAAANWVPTAGVNGEGQTVGVPNAVDEASAPAGPDVYFTTTVGTADSIVSANSAYNSWFGVALARDLSHLTPVSGGGGAVPASDDDLIHLWMKTADPSRIEEIRVYFVCAASFDATILPGTDPGSNVDAYVKSFRQNDFVQFIAAAQTQVEAAQTAVNLATIDQRLAAEGIVDPRTAVANALAGLDPSRAASVQIGLGAHQWFELGAIGVPLRRGDFTRIGGTAGRDWATITGMVIYISTALSPTNSANSFAMNDCYLTGGYGPDTVQPGAQQLDWRYTNYDPRTGAESNGSPTMVVPNLIDSRRQRVAVTPAGYGDGNVRQRFYRRGGAIIDNWYFEGVNASDGGVFDDTLADDALTASATLPIDHFQPVPTIDANGNTVLAQPVAALWGPIQGMLLACGDPHRPGHLYWSLPDSPDHWSASSNIEICPPSEELMNGDLVGTQAFVFSRERLYLLYPDFAGAASVSYTPSQCKRGIPGRQAFCVGPGGIYFVAQNEGIFVTQGGPEEWISRDIDPIFQGGTTPRYGYLPIDWAVTDALRLTSIDNSIYFLYQDTAGNRQVLIYNSLLKFWRNYSFGRALAMVEGREEPVLLLGGLNQGKTYSLSGTSDDGVAITGTARTGSLSGARREEKLIGDQILDADRNGCTLSVQNFLNEEAVANVPVSVTQGVGRTRYVLDAFGDEPQRAHSIATELTWSSLFGVPTLYQLGYAIAVQPEVTSNRVTTWDDLGCSDEFYLTGVTLDVDTGGGTRTFFVEYDYAGVRTQLGPFTVAETGRHKVKFSWPAVEAQQVRLHPDDAVCQFWVFYRADWIFQAEPPRVAGWDIHFEQQWDQYYTGVDLYCDTSGQTKQVVITVDGVTLLDPATGLPYFSVTATGRHVVHLTLPWGRGHVFHLYAIDTNPGLLYQHRWQTIAEPSEQANWNQPFSILGSRADKWLKAVIFECDTFGQTKTVQVEADGVVVETLRVTATGRKSVQVALSQERLGRVWRFFPIDANPGRLYSLQPIFDEEPFSLTRWETQEVNYGLPGWFAPTYGHIVLKATLPVTVTLRRQYNQRGLSKDETYTIPATVGKIRAYLTFQAGRDVLHKWILTSAAPFYLYRDETVIFIQPWGAASAVPVHPFGNDDLDPTRTMTSAVMAAETPGGQAAQA